MLSIGECDCERECECDGEREYCDMHSVYGRETLDPDECEREYECECEYERTFAFVTFFASISVVVCVVSLMFVSKTHVQPHWVPSWYTGSVYF